jgi:hypothetical protein
MRLLYQWAAEIKKMTHTLRLYSLFDDARNKSPLQVPVSKSIDHTLDILRNTHEISNVKVACASPTSILTRPIRW